jgi:hypothetical protein
MPDTERFRPDYPTNRFRVDPIYTRMTLPRGTNDGRGSLPSVQDLFGELSVTSQFKITLFLGDTVSSANSDTNINSWLVSCGVLGSNLFNGNNANLNSLRYEFMCNETSLPGTTLGVTEEFGSKQGITEKFPNKRDFPDISMTFYVDAEYGIIRLFEEWINFINPIHNRTGRIRTGSPAGTLSSVNDAWEILRFRYPNMYKKPIAITKFERDVYVNSVGEVERSPSMLTYYFINAFPTQLTALPVTYEGSTITKTTVNFTYERYVILNHQGTGSIPDDAFAEQFNNNAQIPLLSTPSITFGSSAQTQFPPYFNGTNPSLRIQ